MERLISALNSCLQSEQLDRRMLAAYSLVAPTWLARASFSDGLLCCLGSAGVCAVHLFQSLSCCAERHTGSPPSQMVKSPGSMSSFSNSVECLELQPASPSCGPDWSPAVQAIFSTTVLSRPAHLKALSDFPRCRRGVVVPLADLPIFVYGMTERSQSRRRGSS